MQIETIFENDDILVINKPAGLVVHGDGRTQEPTLVEWLLERYPDIHDVGEAPIVPTNPALTPIIRPGIVHRLDRDTSGVMVVAKNQKAHEFLKEQFHSRGVEKIYQALVWSIISDDSGEVNLPIGKSKTDPRMWSASKNARGTLREARSVYKILERFPAKQKGEEGSTYIEVYPRTGRTHQIRVHMKAIFHPVVCDKLYASKKICPVGGLARQALHASSLTLTLLSGESKTFTAELPEDFRGALEFLRSS